MKREREMVWKNSKLYTTSLTKRKRGEKSPLHTRAYTRVRLKPHQDVPV